MSPPDASQPEPSEGPAPLYDLRHSCAHLMASAVGNLVPGAKYAVGPPIDHGFYYDFDLPRALTDDDLEAIEAEMRRIAAEDAPFKCEEMDRAAARERLEESDQTYKVEILDDIPEDETITFWGHGDWADLCEGPHVERAGLIEHFKIQRLAGAYWRGDEHNQMLQRVYGTAFWSAEDLDAHLEWLEEVSRRDHRTVSKQLELFSTHKETGAGLVFWHPALGAVRAELETWLGAELHRRGYERVYTPHISSEELFEQSGHLENYADSMFAPLDIDGNAYRVKPMNCPGHILIYKSALRSYRELPIRFGELGTVYRYERSGVLHGMLRVRGFTQDDAHIFCMPDQLETEVADCIEFARSLLGLFDYGFQAVLATRPEEKAMGEPAVWDHAQAALEAAASSVGLEMELDEGGGAFYGPKIDFQLTDALGRQWQGPTIQVDFNLPERFDMEYTSADNERVRPVMVHRAMFGSMERFVGGLIEHTGGRFPFWLAPRQVVIMPIKDEQIEFCDALRETLHQDGFRVSLDDDGPLRRRIKAAQEDQAAVMVIVGGREADAGEVSVRLREGGDLGTTSVDEFVGSCQAWRDSRTLQIEGWA